MVGHLDIIGASKIIQDGKWCCEGDGDGHDGVLIVLLYGSWNHRVSAYKSDIPTISAKLKSRNPKVKFCGEAGMKVDANEESYDICIRENNQLHAGFSAPSELPAIALIGVPSSNDKDTNNEDEKTKRVRVEYVSMVGRKLDAYLSSVNTEWPVLLNDMQSTLSRLFDSEGKLRPTSPQLNQKVPRRGNTKPAVRLFISGDRSQVGKSSICMGILGALLKSGKYSPDDLAYIKPATQCEQTQLVQEFCKAKGITSCVPIGPIVYYKGFTRAFLKGDIGETSEGLLSKAGRAVDELAVGKKVVIIDGVGYPAVGSITGTDNASVARSCGTKFPGHTRVPAPVLLIGKSGVGDAVDSFNINATYFTHRGVPVIGAIFNKLSLDGFYSLANCKEAIEMYFSKFQPDKTAFGFIPEIPTLKNAREHVASISEEDKLRQALDTADAFVDQFRQYVNVEAILKAAKDATNAYKQSPVSSSDNSPTLILGKRSAEVSNGFYPNKQNKVDTIGTNKMVSSKPMSLTRAQIEAMASAAGAAGG